MEPVMPSKIAASQVAAIALFEVTAVLDGRTREVVDLLRNKVLR